MKVILTWLYRPYFFNLSKSFRLLISFGFGGFVFLFLYFLTPFNLLALNEHLLEYVSGIGLIVFLSLFFLFFFLPFVFKNFFKPETWTIGRNVVFIVIALLIVSFFMWFFNYKIKATYGMKALSLGRFIYYTFLVGIFPSIMLIFLNEKSLRNKKVKNVEEILLLKNKREKERTSEVIFKSEITNEALKINIKNLVYITSNANYACFFIYENNILKEHVFRITLKKVEVILSNYNEFYRCHKSYIINSNFVNGLEGNARGYVLKSSSIPFEIPVSRSFPKSSLKKLILF